MPDPSLVASEIESVRRLCDDGRVSEAAVLCEGLLQRFPTAADVLFLMGRIVFLRKNLASAEDYLRRAGAQPQALHLLANLYQDRGELDHAVACYRRALRLAPGLAELHNDLGTAYFAKGWYQEAAECYRAAIGLKADHFTAHANLGETLMKLGRYREARKSMQAALAVRFKAFLRGLLGRGKGRA